MDEAEAAVWIRRYLEEDLGPGDVTTEHLVPADQEGIACIVTRDRCFVAGLAPACAVFQALGVQARPLARDGAWAPPGAALLEVEGPARGILAAERTALNLLSRMAGVATATRRVVEDLEARGAKSRVAATRKTTPGFRIFEKEAVRIAGGDPHRRGLWDVAMVKDNHRAAGAASDLGSAVRSLRSSRPELEVVAEAETLAQARDAALAGAQWILVDNQDPETGAAWAAEVRPLGLGTRVEASGGITAETACRYTWADRISMGSLTQGAPVPDLSMEWGRPPGTGVLQEGGGNL